MRTFDPAVYGFAMLQNLKIENSDEEAIIQGISASGVVIGIGGSVVWE